LRSLQEIQPDFVEEAKALAGLWSQGKKKEEFYFDNWIFTSVLQLINNKEVMTCAFTYISKILCKINQTFSINFRNYDR
jgi:hypothetical protein